MKSYTESEIKAIFKEQAYKFASLRDSDSKAVVPYNTVKGKETATDKLNEAFKRLKNLPDGLYTFCFQNSQGRNVVPDTYGYIKGALPVENDNRGTSVHIIQPSKSSDSDKVLSYSEVLNLKLELARAEAERDRYKSDSEQYKKEVEDLESELNNAESKTNELSEGAGTNKWIETLSGSLLPIVDRYLNIREKEANKTPLQNKNVKKVVRSSKKIVLPELGSPNWELWLTQLETYTDEQFNNVLDFLKRNSLIHYNAVLEEFTNDDVDNIIEESEVTND